ncbi:MAG: hydroxylase [Planctomycetota bacterium]
MHYLEIVTPQVEAVCQTYERLHRVTFGEPEPNLGNARTAQLPTGGSIAVRAPLRATEEPVIRPYLLVEDINAAVAEAATSGAKIAVPPMRLPGHGTCAIFIQGGVEHGLWQRDGASQ